MVQKPARLSVSYAATSSKDAPLQLLVVVPLLSSPQKKIASPVGCWLLFPAMNSYHQPPRPLLLPWSSVARHRLPQSATPPQHLSNTPRFSHLARACRRGRPQQAQRPCAAAGGSRSGGSERGRRGAPGDPEKRSTPRLAAPFAGGSSRDTTDGCCSFRPLTSSCSTSHRWWCWGAAFA